MRVSHGRFGRLLFVVCSFCGLALFDACIRPKYYTVQCDPPPPARSAIAWQITARHPGIVHGRVVEIASGQPINPMRGTAARLLPGDSSWQQAGPHGEFEFSGVQGSRELAVKAFGYMFVTASISVPADSGVDALAAMEQRSMTINEVCGTRQRRR